MRRACPIGIKCKTMEANFSPLLLVSLVVLVLLSIVAIFYLYITAKNRERLALIAKGMDPNLARGDFWTKMGIIGGGTGLGLMADGILGTSYGPLMAILLAGAGLVVYGIFRRRQMSRGE